MRQCNKINKACSMVFVWLMLLLLVGCSYKYKEVVLSPDAFYEYPNLEKKLHRDRVMVYGPNAVFDLTNVELNDGVITGNPMLVEDTASWLFKHSLKYAGESDHFPLKIYTRRHFMMHALDSGKDFSSAFTVLPEEIKSVNLVNNYDLSASDRMEQTGIVLIGVILVTFLFLQLASYISSTANSVARCYIATMTYGSYDAPEVMVLRRFRDKVLMKNLPGRLFVAIYYSVGPVLVHLLKNQQLINELIRKILDAVVSVLRKKGYL